MGKSSNKPDRRTLKRHTNRKANKTNKKDVSNLKRRIEIMSKARQRKATARLNISRKKAAEA